MVDEPTAVGNKKGVFDYASVRSERRRRLGSCGSVGRIEVVIDELSRRVFTLTAAIRDGKPRLHVIERGAPAFDRFSDLTIADAVAKTNVHVDDASRLGSG